MFHRTNYHLYDKYVQEAIDVVEQHIGAIASSKLTLLEVQYLYGRLYAKGVRLSK